jgi:hypothetical protein
MSPPWSPSKSARTASKPQLHRAGENSAPPSTANEIGIQPLMATRPLPEPDPVGIELVPYDDEDGAEAIAPQPQALRPTLVSAPAQRPDPLPVPATEVAPEPTPAFSPLLRTLFTIAGGVLLASLLAFAVHVHNAPSLAAATRARQATSAETTHPAKPSAYGEAFTPPPRAHRPKTHPPKDDQPAR